MNAAMTQSPSTIASITLCAEIFVLFAEIKVQNGSAVAGTIL